MSTIYVVGDGYSSRTIRAWVPGDGLVCSSAALAKNPSMRCGVPVAVIINERAARMGRQMNPISRNVCALHLAGQFGVNRGAMRAKADAAAREQVLAAHWDEYQAALDAACDAAEAELLAQIPEDLRALITEAVSA